MALGGGDAVARLLAFTATMYLARVLGVGGYGVIALAMAVELYAAQLADFGIETTGNRDIAANPEQLANVAPALITARVYWPRRSPSSPGAPRCSSCPLPTGR